jgi:hypothetical protein
MANLSPIAHSFGKQVIYYDEPYIVDNVENKA